MRSLVLPLLLVAACDTTTVEIVRPCTVELELDAGTPVQAGTSLTIPGAPLSTSWDTRVRIGGVDAPVTDVMREACLPCDSCRSDAGCASCGTCEGCSAVCEACVQQVTVTVPADLQSGTWDLILFNRHGSSEPTSIDVAAAPEGEGP